MKQTIDYSSLTGEEKRQKAIKDAKFFLGEEHYNKCITVIAKSMTEGTSPESAQFMLSFAGVEGYPAQVMVEEAQKKNG